MKNLTKFVKIPSLVTVRRGCSNLYSPKSLATDVQLRVRERLFKGVYSTPKRERTVSEARMNLDEQRTNREKPAIFCSRCSQPTQYCFLPIGAGKIPHTEPERNFALCTESQIPVSIANPKSARRCAFSQKQRPAVGAPLLFCW